MRLKYVTDAASGQQYAISHAALTVLSDLDVLEHPNGKPVLTMDGLEGSVFFARELTAIKARSYDVKYADLKYRDIFPVSNEGGSGAETILFYTFDQQGMAKLVANYSDDIPVASISGKETPIQVRSSAIGFILTTKDLRAAVMAGRSFRDMSMRAAVRGNEELFNELSFFGDDESGILGLFNNPNIAIGNVPNGAGGNPEWVTKTPGEILADMFSITDDQWSDTLMIETPTRLLLPPFQYKYIMRTPRSDVSDTTIAQFFVQNSEFIDSMDKIIPVNEMTGAGSGGADVMVAYNPDPEKMELEIPMEMQWLAEQRENLAMKVPGEARIAGLNVMYPGSVSIEQDI